MRISVLLLFSCLVILSASAQDQDLKVLATAGNSYQVGNFQLDWTLGESVILTFDHPPVLLTNGFQQPTYELISSVDVPSWAGRVEAFPNPCNDILNLHLNFPTAESGFLELLDMSGVCFGNESFSGISLDKQFSLTSLPAGQYIINIVLPTKHVHQNISIIKL